MSRHERRIQALLRFWADQYSDGSLQFHTCMMIAVGLLGLLEIIALLWLVPYSVFRSIRSKQ